LGVLVGRAGRFAPRSPPTRHPLVAHASPTHRLLVAQEQFFAMFSSQFDSSKFDIDIKAKEGINDSFSFEDAAAALSAHPTWRAAATTMTDDERRSLFDRWVEKRREEAREAKRRRLMDYLEACQWITVRTTWKEACDALYRIPEFEALSKYDQVDVFDTFMAKVEVREVQSQSVGRLSFLLSGRAWMSG